MSGGRYRLGCDAFDEELELLLDDGEAGLLSSPERSASDQLLPFALPVLFSSSGPWPSARPLFEPVPDVPREAPEEGSVDKRPVGESVESLLPLLEFIELRTLLMTWPS